MKIVLEENAGLDETEIVVRCPAVDDEVLRLLAGLRSQRDTLPGVKDGSTYPVNIREILYFDTADKRTFFYTADAVFETPLRLYEAEERLPASRFCRVSKSCILHVRRIRSLAPDFGGRLEVTMENGEKLNISRQYAAALKKLLGIGKESTE